MGSCVIWQDTVLMGCTFTSLQLMKIITVRQSLMEFDLLKCFNKGIHFDKPSRNCKVTQDDMYMYNLIGYDLKC